MLIAGVLTRLVTVPLIVTMVGAIALVKVDVGFIVADAAGAELDVALLAGLLGLLFIGPGRLSVDGLLHGDGDRAGLASGGQVGVTLRRQSDARHASAGWSLMRCSSQSRSVCINA